MSAMSKINSNGDVYMFQYKNSSSMNQRDNFSIHIISNWVDDSDFNKKFQLNIKGALYLKQLLFLKNNV